MNPQKVRLDILSNAHDRERRGKPILRTPRQYSEELGFPEKEVKLAFEYLIDEHMMNGTAEMLRTGLVIYRFESITAKGIAAVEQAVVSSKPQTGSGVRGPPDALELFDRAVRQIEESGAGTEEKAQAKALLEFAKTTTPQFLPSVVDAVEKALGL